MLISGNVFHFYPTDQWIAVEKELKQSDMVRQNFAERIEKYDDHLKICESLFIWCLAQGLATL